MKNNYLVITAVACVAVLGTSAFVFCDKLQPSAAESPQILPVEDEESAVDQNHSVSETALQAEMPNAGEAKIDAEKLTTADASNNCPMEQEKRAKALPSSKADVADLDVCGLPLSKFVDNTTERQNIVRVAGSNVEPSVKQTVSETGASTNEEKERTLGASRPGLPTQTDPNGFISLPPQSNGLQKTSDYS